MDDFEKEFDETFPTILKKTGAFLYWLHPPTRCAGMRGSQPVFVITGRALFDVAGWRPVKPEPDLAPVAAAIGIEVKRNGDHHTSMRIIGEDGRGSGLQAHQLEALASLHRSGGIARVLWNNGGEIGVLDGEVIADVFMTYGVSVQAEKMRKSFAKGSRSIAWNLFRKIDLTANPESVIIGPVNEPTVAEVLKRSRRKARKQIEEANDEPVTGYDIEDLCDADD